MAKSWSSLAAVLFFQFVLGGGALKTRSTPTYVEYDKFFTRDKSSWGNSQDEFKVLDEEKVLRSVKATHEEEEDIHYLTFQLASNNTFVPHDAVLNRLKQLPGNKLYLRGCAGEQFTDFALNLAINALPGAKRVPVKPGQKQWPEVPVPPSSKKQYMQFFIGDRHFRDAPRWKHWWNNFQEEYKVQASRLENWWKNSQNEFKVQGKSVQATYTESYDNHFLAFRFASAQNTDGDKIEARTVLHSLKVIRAKSGAKLYLRGYDRNGEFTNFAFNCKSNPWDGDFDLPVKPGQKKW